MQMKVAVVDDMDEDLHELEKAIIMAAPGTECDLYPDAEAMLAHFAAGKYQIVFLDIQMERMNGIELAGKLRQMDTGLLIVFQTTSREYAFDAFPIHPFDYIIKPYGDEDIKRVLSEAKRVLGRVSPEITVRIAHGSMRLPTEKIISIVSDNHTVMIYLDGVPEPVRSIDTFSTIEEKISGEECFISCNRGIYLNMDHVVHILDDSIKMKDGNTYPLRVRDRSSIKKTFAQYRISSMKADVKEGF